MVCLRCIFVLFSVLPSIHAKEDAADTTPHNARMMLGSNAPLVAMYDENERRRRSDHNDSSLLEGSVIRRQQATLEEKSDLHIDASSFEERTTHRQDIAVSIHLAEDGRRRRIVIYQRKPLAEESRRRRVVIYQRDDEETLKRHAGRNDHRHARLEPPSSPSIRANATSVANASLEEVIGRSLLLIESGLQRKSAKREAAFGPSLLGHQTPAVAMQAFSSGHRVSLRHGIVAVNHVFTQGLGTMDAARLERQRRQAFSDASSPPSASFKFESDLIRVLLKNRTVQSRQEHAGRFSPPKAASASDKQTF